MAPESPQESIPEGLDDLLRSIQEDKEKVEDKSGALVVYEPTRDEELVDEEIDERILNILGLDDVVGIDYGTYKTLLKEKMTTGRMADSQIPTEEVELLTNEYKRVKSETGRFKIKKKKISVESFTEEQQKAETKPQKTQVTSLLPGVNLKKEEEDQEEQREEDKKQTDSIEGLKSFVERSLVPALSKVEKNLEGIVSTIEKQVELESKQEKKEKVAAEKTKKRVREEKSEIPRQNKFTKTLDKVAKPVKGFIERVIEIFSSFLLGSGLLRLIDILKDPMGYLDKIVDFANGIIKSVEDQIKKIISPFYDSVNFVISQINNIGQKIEDTMNSVKGLFGQEPDNDIFTPIGPVKIPDVILPRISDPDPETGPDVQKPKPTQQLVGGGEVINIQNISYEGGGSVNKDSGITITGMGPDTQLIAAQPGEIVMSKKAVDSYGVDTLLSMNKEAGGTNKPKFGNIQGFQGGGRVSKNSQTSSPSPAGGNRYTSLLSFISKGEGGYNSMNQGTIGNRIVGSTHNASGIVGKNLPEMTIGEVMDRQAYLMNPNNPQQSDYGIFAAGRYQIIPDTMKFAVAKSGLNRNDMFSPENQDKLGMVLITQKQPRVGAYLSGKSDDIEGAMDALANEFASMPDPRTGNSKYGSGNRALHTVQEVKSALLQAKGITTPVNVASQPPSRTIKPPSSRSKVVPLPIPSVGGGSQKSPILSGSGANQKQVPSFSSSDVNNPELIAVKAIYNIVGS